MYDKLRDKLISELACIPIDNGSSVIRLSVYSYDNNTPKLQLQRIGQGGSTGAVSRLSKKELIALAPAILKWILSDN